MDDKYQDKYLDDNGLSFAWEIIKKRIEDAVASSHYRMATITLLNADWEKSEDGTYYLQSVTIPSTTANSKVDLQPTPEQLVMLMEEEITMYIANDEGKLTAYAIGAIPSTDITIKALISEAMGGSSLIFGDLTVTDDGNGNVTISGK